MTITLTKQYLEGKAREIIQDLKTNFTNQDKLLIGGLAEDGSVLYEEAIIDDLGDFIPFTSYFEDEIAQSHITYLEDNIEKVYFDNAFAYSDFILGLIWYGKIKDDYSRTGELARLYERKFWDLYSRKGHLYSYRRMGKTLSILNTLDSTFIEMYTELDRIFPGEYRERTMSIYRQLCQNSSFKKQGLLPEMINYSPWLYPLKLFFSSRFSRVVVMKNNTNFGFGLLDLYRLTGDADVLTHFDRLFEGITHHVIDEEGAHNYPFEKDRASLLASFAVIDLLCDAAECFGDDKYLSEAKKLANTWCARQSEKTGLFPKFVGADKSYLDSESDMIVALCKLYQLTGDERYFKSAEKALQGIFNHHRGEYGYILEVNIYTGEPINGSYKTKFNALLLKPIIYFLEKDDIYKNEKLFTLLKDR